MSEKPQTIEQLSSLTAVRLLTGDKSDYAKYLREFGELCYAQGRASAAPKEGEVERLEPNTFWPDNCEEGEGPSDLELIADGYEDGTVFAVQQAIMLPRGFYVSITDTNGCTDVRPATADEIERFKADEAERLEKWRQRAKQLPDISRSALSPASEGGK